MTVTIDIRLYGDPVTQGSKTAFVPKVGTRPVVVEQGRAKLTPWRQEIAGVAADAMQGKEMLVGVPVGVTLYFYVKRPKAAKTDYWSYKRPDIDKLTRAVLDALTGIVYKDDGQVASLYAIKCYETEDQRTGVRIRVQALE